MDDSWELNFFARYRHYPVTSSLQKYVHIWEFKEIQRVKVSKSAILPKLFGWYVILEIRLLAGF